CYIGSAVRFSTGVTIADNSIVGIGSIVTKKFTNEYVLNAGNPVKIVRENFDWKIKHKS
ncbi:MAG: acetyltransferase, partial [Bacteroidetes bacterium]